MANSDTTRTDQSLPAKVHKIVQQMWRDLLSVYYANTPTWRWLKSGALVFLGFFVWTGSSVLLSVGVELGILTYTMAYGFLLIVWGPFTHLVVVPVTIRLRRTASHPALRWFSQNSGKVNLSIFFALVIIFGAVTPSIMMLEFSSSLPGGSTSSFSGELVCNTGEEVVTCHVENAEGIDSVEVRSGGETVRTVDSEPFEFEIPLSEIGQTRTGQEFRVLYYDADGEILHREIRTV